MLGARARRLRVGRRRHGGFDGWQLKSKSAAFASFARYGDVPAVQRGEPLHEREPDTEPADASVNRRSNLDEGIEHLTEHFRGNANAVVFYAEHDELLFPTKAHANSPSGFCVLGGVGQEIRHHLLETGRVCHRVCRRVCVDFELVLT